MGIGNSKVDNASSGGIVVGIRSDGQLREVAYSAAGQKFDVHPTTGILFENYYIPNFDKVKSIVKCLAAKNPHFRLVSWDIAIDENDNPVLIEANLCDGELDFHQLNNGPIFGEETKEILDEVFG